MGKTDVLELVTRGPDDTRALAATVAGALRRGDVVALTGELGAGKTCFVQGAAAALGVTARVTSPSFVLRRDYPGDPGVRHLDVYRLDTLQQVLDLGYLEDGVTDTITFIEWGDAISPLLPAGYLEVELRLADVLADDDDPSEGLWRRVVLRARGDEWRRRMVGLSVDTGRWAAAAQER